MLDTGAFGAALERRGFDFYSGVPCSFLKALFNYSINKGRFVMAANEGDAAAICSGAFLAGKKPVLMCQNSGLANAVSPLTSLNHIFKIPLMGFVSLRGEPGLNDEPQHELMGRITSKLLDVMEIRHEVLSCEPREAEEQIERAAAAISENISFFFIVKKGTFGPVELNRAVPSIRAYEGAGYSGGVSSAAPAGGSAVISQAVSAARDNSRVSRIDAIAALSAARGRRDIFIAATGKTGRELYEANDAPGNLYMVGSMGCAGQIALGLAMSRPEARVIALDGDGAVLMRAGSLATSGWYSPPNMLHILFDNESHDSTGGQFTVSPGVDFVSAASAFGYKRSARANSAGELVEMFNDWKKTGGLAFIHLKVSPSPAEAPGRPKIRPFEVKERLMKYIEEFVKGASDD
jgi:phosphonopyruvate decarboxylase